MCVTENVYDVICDVSTDTTDTGDDDADEDTTNTTGGGGTQLESSDHDCLPLSCHTPESPGPHPDVRCHV